MREPKERLRDIIDAINSIERYRYISFTDLESNELLPTWFLHHLQIIGEAAKALPQDVRAMAPEVAWSDIIGLRNILVHQYFEIDLLVVWKIIQNDIPILKSQISDLLVQLEGAHLEGL